MLDTILTSWGANSYGQLCTGDEEDRSTPTLCEIPNDDIVEICGGGGHTLFLLRSGGVLACGSNTRGQLGVDGPSASARPLPVPLPRPARRLGAGWETSFAVAEGGELYAWGSNSHGQLGVGMDAGAVTMPTQVQLDEAVMDVAAGSRHALAVTASGRTLTWGWNKKGQLGRSAPVISNRPGPVPDVDSAVQCVAGDHHSAVLLGDGTTVLAWGDNRYGQCGEGSTDAFCSRPARLQLSHQGRSVERLVSGWTHLAALMSDAGVLTWGRNSYCQLGRPGPNSATPGPVPGLRAARLACGAQHSLCLSSDGALLAWGWNEHGICAGDGDADVPAPRGVSSLPPGARPFLLGCGAGTSFALCRRERE